MKNNHFNCEKVSEVTAPAAGTLYLLPPLRLDPPAILHYHVPHVQSPQML